MPDVSQFNGRLRNECLNEHTEERLKKGPGGLTPASYARQLENGAQSRSNSKLNCY